VAVGALVLTGCNTQVHGVVNPCAHGGGGNECLPQDLAATVDDLPDMSAVDLKGSQD